MAKMIRSYEPAPGGYYVTIEVNGAYTDGTSRFDRVFVSRDAMHGKSTFERRQAIFDAIEDNPLDGIKDLVVQQPTQTKEIWEQRAIEAHATWWRWKTTHEEAVTRALPAIVQTALSNRVDAAWAAYLVILNAWRQAT